jgi:hypothetical protein
MVPFISNLNHADTAIQEEVINQQHCPKKTIDLEKQKQNLEKYGENKFKIEQGKALWD